MTAKDSLPSGGLSSLPYLTHVTPCSFKPTQRPLLIVVIDTEEEFDWTKGFSSDNNTAESMRYITRIQNVFDDFGIKPVYVMDYPIASQPVGYEPLQRIFSDKRCEIGSHLHPWVNPPLKEEVNRFNSFPGNLSRELETSKLCNLGEVIQEHFGIYPRIYKAGRYGIGPHTQSILEELGYQVDLSLCPYMDYSPEGGPNFSMCTPNPFWFGNTKKMLELPLTVGYSGLARKWGHGIHTWASSPNVSALHAIGIFARLRIVDKIWLSPEGYRTSEHIKLAKDLFADGLRVFSFAFHSPSVEPGHTPYVRTEDDLKKFLRRCSKFFEFFMKELNGQPTTPLEVVSHLSGENITNN